MAEPTMRSIPIIRLKQVRERSVRFRVDKVTRPADVYAAVIPYYRGADREILSAICLDAQNQPTAFNVASVGSLNCTRTRPADILKPAIISNALGILLVHNHPSGSLEPSDEDVDFTRAIARACEQVGIELYDHLVISDHGFTSLRERGLL
jgi:DNA repair protein RadC